MNTFKTHLSGLTELINKHLDTCLPPATTRPAQLHEAMRYSIFAGGKRFRPALCIATCQACGGSVDAALQAACSLELLHTYTLIHDDLPSMDDDTLRRGKPTCHIAFNESTAILAGDALLTLAFELLGSYKEAGPLVSVFGAATGSRGLIAGQVEDIAAEGTEPNDDLVRFIHLNKTAALIRVACVMGGICAGASDETLKQLALYGENIGLAFQLADDLLDECSTVEELGKDIGSDKERGKLTYVRVHGAEKTKADAQLLIDQAKQQLSGFEHNTDVLSSLADTILSKLP